MLRVLEKLKLPPKMCRIYEKNLIKSTREVIRINEIKYEELLSKIKQGALLIDVRTRQEFKEGHIEGALLIPYYEIKRNIEKMVPDKNQEIVLYCKNGGRSLKAYEILKKLEYKNIYNLKGGLEER